MDADSSYEVTASITLIQTGNIESNTGTSKSKKEIDGLD